MNSLESWLVNCLVLLVIGEILIVADTRILTTCWEFESRKRGEGTLDTCSLLGRRTREGAGPKLRGNCLIRPIEAARRRIDD